MRVVQPAFASALCLAFVAAHAAPEDAQDPAKSEEEGVPPAPLPQRNCTPKAIATPAPPYPKKFLTTGRSGIVRFSFRVLPDGTVSEVRALQNPDAELASYAIPAVKKWKFEPVGCLLPGEQLWMTSSFTFRIDE